MRAAQQTRQSHRIVRAWPRDCTTWRYFVPHSTVLDAVAARLQPLSSPRLSASDHDGFPQLDVLVNEFQVSLKPPVRAEPSNSAMATHISDRGRFSKKEVVRDTEKQWDIVGREFRPGRRVQCRWQRLTLLGNSRTSSAKRHHAPRSTSRRSERNRDGPASRTAQNPFAESPQFLCSHWRRVFPAGIVIILLDIDRSDSNETSLWTEVLLDKSRRGLDISGGKPRHRESVSATHHEGCCG